MENEKEKKNPTFRGASGKAEADSHSPLGPRLRGRSPTPTPGDGCEDSVRLCMSVPSTSQQFNWWWPALALCTPGPPSPTAREATGDDAMIHR